MIIKIIFILINKCFFDYRTCPPLRLHFVIFDILFISNDQRSVRPWNYFTRHFTKMKFSVRDFFSKCEQIHIKLRICSDFLTKYLTKNFIFCAEKEFGSIFFCCIETWNKWVKRKPANFILQSLLFQTVITP